MDSDNYVSITGRMASDVELRFTAAGTAVAGFRLAHTPRIREGNDWRDGEPSFFDVTAWKKLAERAAELPKGTPIRVTGALLVESWKTREGQNRYSTKINAQGIEIMIVNTRMETSRGNVSLSWGKNLPPPVDNGIENSLFDEDDKVYSEEPF